jgi:hypothetical protein
LAQDLPRRIILILAVKFPARPAGAEAEIEIKRKKGGAEIEIKTNEVDRRGLVYKYRRAGCGEDAKCI